LISEPAEMSPGKAKRPIAKEDGYNMLGKSNLRNLVPTADDTWRKTRAMLLS
jgi:hypothetical protein